MDEINKYRKLKLKRIRLSEIILKNKLKSDTDSYNIKTERPNIKSRDKFIINNKSPYLNILNTTYLYKKNIPILNLKYKSPQRKRNLPDINKIIKNKNEKKGKSIGANSSYSYRCAIAARNGIGGGDYQGRPHENIYMLQLLREGRLIIP